MKETLVRRGRGVSLFAAQVFGFVHVIEDAIIGRRGEGQPVAQLFQQRPCALIAGEIAKLRQQDLGENNSTGCPR